MTIFNVLLPFIMAFLIVGGGIVFIILFAKLCRELENIKW